MSTRRPSHDTLTTPQGRETNSMNHRSLILGIACAAVGASTASAQLAALDTDTRVDVEPRGFSSGPDVLYQNLTSINTFGPVGGTMAYIADSYTCNVGDAGLLFGGGNGTPVLVWNIHRYHDGRLEQLGMSWAKHACCAIQGSGCGLPCSGGGGLGSGCRDIYSAGWNSSQGSLGPRSAINAWTGNVPGIEGVGGSTIAGRTQVAQSDLLQEGSGAVYYMEGVYVGSDDAPAGNSYNNASYKRVTINEANFGMSPTGAMVEGEPAIYAWQDNDASVSITPVDVPGEGRFFFAAKVSDNGDGTNRYEYAIYNLNSHRSGGSFSVPVPAGVVVSNAGFHDVDYHSGEPYDNTDWNISTDGGAVTWSSPQTHAQNADSNAIRWGTMYNFWFDATGDVSDADADMGLFRPGAPDSISVNLPAPGLSGCNAADLAEPLGQLDFSDISAFLTAFSNSQPEADLAVPFGQWDFSDITAFLNAFSGGCP